MPDTMEWRAREWFATQDHTLRMYIRHGGRWGEFALSSLTALLQAVRSEAIDDAIAMMPHRPELARAISELK